MPDLRNGIRTDYGERGSSEGFGAVEHDSPFLDFSSTDSAGPALVNVIDAVREHAYNGSSLDLLGPVYSFYPGRAVGRLAFFSKSRCLDTEQKSKHVHFDRTRRRCCIFV